MSQIESNEKKRIITEKKHHSNLATIQLMRFLETSFSKNELLKVIETKAISELEKNGLAMLIKFQIEKEVLQVEEKILTQFLKRL